MKEIIGDLLFVAGAIATVFGAWQASPAIGCIIGGTWMLIIGSALSSKGGSRK